MKRLVFILFITIFFSCEEKELPDICWECKSVVYGKNITDYYCSKMITGVEEYKSRLMDFYEGSMTTIECVMIKDSI